MLCQLDAGESDIIGLNHLLQDTLSRYSSPTLRRFLARSFTLVLIETPTAGAAAAASAAGNAASPRESVSPSNPQSLAALEQLQPGAVFDQLYRSKYNTDTPAALSAAFAELLLADDTGEAGGV